MTDAALEVLLEIRDELRGLRRALRTPDGVLVDAIATETAGKAFTVTELLEFAEVTPALRSAIEEAGAASGKALGKLLARIEGQSFEGWRIEREGENREGVLWVCARKPVSLR